MPQPLSAFSCVMKAKCDTCKRLNNKDESKEHLSCGKHAQSSSYSHDISRCSILSVRLARLRAVISQVRLFS